MMTGRADSTAAGGRLPSRLALCALALVLAGGVAHSAATRADAPAAPAFAGVEAMFPDAPDGVDPMVTGPVSASFRQAQQDLSCADAAWPNVPAGCYPR